jgi:hypothetical protein
VLSDRAQKEHSGAGLSASPARLPACSSAPAESGRVRGAGASGTDSG